MRAMLALALLVVAGSASAQSITEFPIPSPDVDSWDLCLGPDGAIWFNEPLALGLGRIDMQGNITEFPVGHGPYGCAAGPDGNVWFTAGSSFGRMTTSGQVTLFPDLETAAAPIIAGSDGNLWVGLLEGRIARITPNGAVTYFSLGLATPLSGIGGPHSLALGADGNVWYALPTVDVVGRITPDGSVTNYSTPGVDPFAIAAGPDGALWFAGSMIGRITTQGDLQTFDPLLGGLATGAGVGPDGNVWLAESLAEKIGRVTPQGLLTEFDLPNRSATHFAAGAFDVLTGPDGSLWYVRRGENRIGRVTLAGRRQPVERPRERGRAPIVVPRPE